MSTLRSLYCWLYASFTLYIYTPARHAREYAPRLTDKGWYYFVPIYIGDLDSPDGPIVHARSPLMDWSLSWIAAIENTLVPDAPGFKIVHTGLLPQPQSAPQPSTSGGRNAR